MNGRSRRWRVGVGEIGEGVEVSAAGGEDDLPGGVSGEGAQGGGVEGSVTVEVGVAIVQAKDCFEVGGDVDEGAAGGDGGSMGVTGGVRYRGSGLRR
ncbi:hypothetical protein [Rhodococcus sp. I2R]|uniref:hypothetical protein n=1 Tax=Rhodococcus sp. I2R TaxID=2855445 RepID=UPI001E4A015C|nr:hypothetical protein [Rhodococcus sp. I2R]MCC8928105.1 hypothetical protein [Rhodococcus sp. I2R]